MSDPDGVGALSPMDSSSPDLRYLDDLRIGDRFLSSEYQLDRQQLIDFAAQYDPQPFHTDDDAASASLFRGLAASGWQTAGITMRLLVQSMPIAGGLIGVGAEIAWPHPTRPGDRLRVESRILDIRISTSKPDRGVVTIESHTLNQNAEVVQRVTSKLLVFRRPVQ